MRLPRHFVPRNDGLGWWDFHAQRNEENHRQKTMRGREREKKKRRRLRMMDDFIIGW